MLYVLSMFILDASVLAGLGWVVRKDQQTTEKDLRSWGAKPVAVKVPRLSLYKAQGTKRLYKLLDAVLDGPNTYTPKHNYVHP